jgi:hypothetical protein
MGREIGGRVMIHEERSLVVAILILRLTAGNIAAYLSQLNVLFQLTMLTYGRWVGSPQYPCKLP